MAMTINIYDYFDRWAINYIVYHGQHLEEYGDVAAADSHFSALYQQQATTLNEIDISGNVMTNMRSRGAQAAQPLKIADSIQKGEFTDQVLVEIQDLMNRGLDLASAQVSFDNYMEIINSVGSFSSMLADGGKVSQINEFFNLLLFALDQAQLLSMEVLDILTDIGKHLAGTSFSIDQAWRNQVVTLDEADIQLAQKVLDSLTRVVTKMRSTGAVNARSFAGTIRSIFNNMIGGKIQQMMIAEALAVEGAETFNKQLAQMASALSKNGKFTYEQLPSKKSYTSFQRNIFNTGVFSMILTKNGKQLTVEIASKLDIQKSKGKRGIAFNWASGDVLSNVVNWSGEEKYLGYNMLANSYWFGETANKVRASVAASFFNEAFSQGIIPGSNNTMQLLFIKGKLVSVGRVINNICNEIAELGANDAFEMDNVSNSWVGGRANLLDALTRSKIVNKLIDTLTIAATLNENILLRYVY